ncbi:laminin subunit gamma-1 isoform X2 [Adelges cooleyi]|uniref:laminin subunit gamma-1 isoform X2 n=1 Tax=Adelges cooleyi TaxID=133065 RepID=UPI00217F3CA5|nr:laminin subunit gamma-1 isoform X2 [Adelges cooleyi]
MTNAMEAATLCWLFFVIIPLCKSTDWDGFTPWFTGSECNCNGFSHRCFFDKDLYDRTGHGGHCLDCAGNRDGSNCERCRENYFQRKGEIYCTACECNEIGSWSLQCNSEGKCQCRPGVTGDKCDRCEENYFDFGPTGCKACGCNVAGSLDNQPRCNPETGHCICKENVEGIQCNRCKPSFFNLDEDNEFGCTPCFCYGHSSVCQSASGYSKVSVESVFARGSERWNGSDVYGRTILPVHSPFKQSLEISSPSREPVYFLAPDKFLGDQRSSYNHDLTFKLSIGENSPEPTVNDVVLEGGSGIRITQTIFGQGNPLPSDTPKMFKFRLHESPDYGWQPRLSTREFFNVLSNLTAVKVRGTFTERGVGFLDDFSLQTARRGAPGLPAHWVEMCTCPEGYIGQFCESCAPGSRHEPTSGGPFSPCVPCNCHGHASICDADTGRCICQHNTAGENCDRCAKGYYGNALQGTAYDCKLCPCPNQGSCVLIGEDTVICLECPKGYGGPRCDICSDGYFGDPTGKNGLVSICKPCDCNSNVDPNGIGNCNRTTGECLKCIYNTGGQQCDQCLPGFFGDALAPTKGDCKPCDCYHLGTTETGFGPLACDQLTGQCQCKPHVVGVNCDQCEVGHFNIISGDGCQSCECDPIGSLNNTCDAITGQCVCRPGITGKKCDGCEPFHYGYSTEGCKPCACDSIGSVSLQCDASGQCPCLENVEGRRCDQCKENKYDRQRGCVDCPACYNLVQDAVEEHRNNLKKLEKVLKDINNSPTVINDSEFEQKLREVQSQVDELEKNAKSSGGGNISTSDKIQSLQGQIKEIKELMAQTSNWTSIAERNAMEAEKNVTEVERINEETTDTLKRAMDYIQTEGATALAKAIVKSDELGQQSDQMSEIAREARTFVQLKEDEARKMRDTAEKAINVSALAFEITKDAVNQQKNISDELKTLDTEMNFVKDKLNAIVEQANETKDLVAMINNDSLAIYSDIYAINLPDINATAMKQNASALNLEIQQIKDEIKRLQESNSNLLMEVAEELQQSDVTLQQGEMQKKTRENYLAQANASYEKATQAVKLGAKTLEEAQQTLYTLQAFDKQVQDSKTSATEALEQVPEIKKLIEEANDKTTRAQRALTGAENSAINARNLAQQAQTTFAEQASMEAEKIKKSATETVAEVRNLLDESDGLSKRVGHTGGRLREVESQFEQDQESINDAKKKIGQAKTSASDAKKTVNKAREDVDAILKELKDLVDVDSEKLNQLSSRLEAAEQELTNAKLDEKLVAINEARISQAQLIKNYEEEIAALASDVDNIDAIRKALPVGCFKRPHLELR